MLSRATVDAVIEKLKLAQLPEFDARQRRRRVYSKACSMSCCRQARRHRSIRPERDLKQRIINSFYAKLKVYRAEDTNIIEVGFTSPVPSVG